MKEAPDASLPRKASHGPSTARASTIFTIKMICKGEEQSTNLPLDQAMIGQLALEAEIRDMRISELLAALIIASAKKDLFEILLQQHPKRGANEWHRFVTPEICKVSTRAEK